MGTDRVPGAALAAFGVLALIAVGGALAQRDGGSAAPAPGEARQPRDPVGATPGEDARGGAARDAASALAAPARRGAPGYVGSAACAGCHADHHEGWLATVHPRQERMAGPDTVLGDFAAGEVLDMDGIPLRPFREGDRFFVEAPDDGGEARVYPIVRVIGGSMYKQRYVTTLPNGADAVLPFEWNMPAGRFQPYHAPSGYRPGQAEYWAGPSRAWALRCAGCHVVGLELEVDAARAGSWPRARYVELGVGCESCHGPGEAHARAPRDPEAAIVNPKALGPEAAFAICASCHARGTAGPEEGAPVRVEYPYAFRPGDPDIHRTFVFSKPLQGLSSWAFWANRRSRQHHQQANDLERSLHFQRAGITCMTCHESHGKARYGSLREDPRSNRLCLDCHKDRAAPERLRAHTRHAPDGPGSQCVACHMPKVVTHANPEELRSHTFWRPSPAYDARVHVPEACTLCHTDRTRAWAAEALDRWRFD